MTGEPVDELRAAAMHGIRWSSIARPITEVLLLGSMVLLARLIPPAEFGHYAVALVIQEVAMSIPSEGVGTALVQRKDLRREHLQAGMALALLMGVILVVLSLSTAQLIVDPIFGSTTALFVALTAPLCFVSALSAVPTASLCRRMAFQRLSIMEVVTTLVRVAVCIGLALAGLGGKALIFGTLAGAVVAMVMAWVSAPPPLPRLRIAPARELLDYGLPASLAAVGWAGFRNSDYAIIGARLGAVSAGMYFRAYTLAIEYQKKVSMVMGQVGFPLLSRTRSADQMADMRRQMIHLLTITLFPLLVLLAIGSPVLVPFLFGSRWDAMIVPAQILAIGGASTLVIDAAGTVLMASGRARALLGYGVGHWIIYGLSVFFVAPLGIVAVAIDAAVVHTLFLFVAYALMLSDSDTRPLRCLWDDVAPATISCLGLAAVVVPASIALSAAHTPAILWLMAIGLLAVPPYLFTLRICFPEAWRSLRKVVEQFVPEHHRFRWVKQRLAAADARPAA
jgi:O-antigen/teichoic acid export membrane protein